MKERRLIIDTTLRDGEQSPFVHLSAENKVHLAGLMDQIGIYQIEAGIPAMGLSEQRVISRIMEKRKRSRISVWCRMQKEDIRKAIQCEPDVIHISVPVSYRHIYTMLGKNKAWILKTLTEVLELASQSSCKISVGFEDSSRAELSFLMRLASILEPYGTEILRITDTVGVSTPYMIRDLVKTILNFTNIPIEIHVHNDLGMAVANTAEALKAGATFGDTTLCGIGERSGNCNMVDLLNLISPLYDVGIRLDEAEVVQDIFCGILNENG